jgi:hypothetical protein
MWNAIAVEFLPMSARFVASSFAVVCALSAQHEFPLRDADLLPGHNAHANRPG